MFYDLIFLLHLVQMLRVRNMLTDVLLTVTTEELHKIAHEAYTEAARGVFSI